MMLSHSTFNKISQLTWLGFGLGLIIILLVFGWLWSEISNHLHPYTQAIYPWSALQQLIYHTNNTPRLNTILTLTLFAPVSLIAWLFYSHINAKKQSIFGDAHWATTREIKQMGLFKPNDIIIGWHNNRLLRAPLSSHLLVFAPSRSGKGVSQVIPNALAFKGSMLILDIKQEIFNITSGFRAMHGQQIFLFAPGNLDGKTHRWNPLDLVSSHPGRLIADLQMIIEILIPKPDNTKDAMWYDEARALCLGLLLWLKESGRPCTLGELNHILKGTTNLTTYIQDILTSAFIADGLINLNHTAYINLNNFLQKADKEQSGVKSNLTSRLTLWDDPYIVAATSKSDFDIREIRKTPMTIYLGIPTNQLERLAPLMNLFIQQFLSCMTENLPGGDEPYRVLAILDEFCALGKMQKLRKGLAFLAGYHIHLMPIIQNIGEFYALYGRDSSDIFFQNTDYKIMYRQNATTDKEFVSRALGDRTVQVSSKSRHSNLQNTSNTTSEQSIKRPLISADEVGSFPKEYAIAQLGGEPPIKFKRIIYYRDEPFKKRILPPVDIPNIEPTYPIINSNCSIGSKITHPPINHDAFTPAELIEAMTIYENLNRGSANL